MMSTVINHRLVAQPLNGKVTMNKKMAGIAVTMDQTTQVHLKKRFGIKRTKFPIQTTNVGKT